MFPLRISFFIFPAFLYKTVKPMKKFLSCCFLLFIAIYGHAPAYAQSMAPDLLSLSIGEYDVFDSDNAAEFRGEYRPGTDWLIASLRPWLGAEATTDGTIWGGGGLLYDLQASEKINVTPSLGAGLYTEGSSDLDLGSPIEFRSQIEVSYKIVGETRLGVSISHMSNWGLDDKNPGAESVNLYVHVPLSGLTNLVNDAPQ